CARRRRDAAGFLRHSQARGDARHAGRVRLGRRRREQGGTAARPARHHERQRRRGARGARGGRAHRRRRDTQGAAGRAGDTGADRTGRGRRRRPRHVGRLVVISNFFIDRPLFATVVSAFIVIAGLAAFRGLPVAMYPDITPPQVAVTTVYPGASADVVAETVATPLEQALNGVENMIYLRSASSASGSLEIAVTFAVGTDPDIAVINVQNRVQSALQLLPEEVRRQGVTVAKTLPSFLQIITFDSPDGRYDELYVSNFATLNVIDELRRVPGVGNVQVFGARDYSIRIWLEPDRLAELGLSPSDVADAIREQNAQSAAGRLGEEPMPYRVDMTFTVTTQARLSSPEQFERIVLKTGANGAIV